MPPSSQGKTKGPGDGVEQPCVEQGGISAHMERRSRSAALAKYGAREVRLPRSAATAKCASPEAKAASVEATLSPLKQHCLCASWESVELLRVAKLDPCRDAGTQRCVPGDSHRAQFDHLRGARAMTGRGCSRRKTGCTPGLVVLNVLAAEVFLFPTDARIRTACESACAGMASDRR